VVGSLTTGSSTSQTLTNIFAGTVGLEEEGEEQQGQEDNGRLEMASAHNRIVEVLQKKSPLAILSRCEGKFDVAGLSYPHTVVGARHLDIKPENLVLQVLLNSCPTP